MTAADKNPVLPAGDDAEGVMHVLVPESGATLQGEFAEMLAAAKQFKEQEQHAVVVQQPELSGPVQPDFSPAVYNMPTAPQGTHDPFGFRPNIVLPTASTHTANYPLAASVPLQEMTAQTIPPALVQSQAPTVPHVLQPASGTYEQHIPIQPLPPHIPPAMPKHNPAVEGGMSELGERIKDVPPPVIPDPPPPPPPPPPPDSFSNRFGDRGRRAYQAFKEGSIGVKVGAIVSLAVGLKGVYDLTQSFMGAREEKVEAATNDALEKPETKGFNYSKLMIGVAELGAAAAGLFLTLGGRSR